MSSRASRPRPRPASTRSRRQRLAAGAVLATTSLLGTYLAAIRPQPTYAAPNTGSEQGDPWLSTANSGLCTIADDTTVYDDTSLRTAIAQSNDDSVICIGASFTVSSELVIDDTAITIIGDDSSITLSGSGGHRLFDVNFDDSGNGKTITFQDITLRDGYDADDGGAIDINHNSLTVPVYDDTVLIQSVNFINNEAEAEGGAVYARNLAALVIADSYFSGNKTIIGNDGDDGGAVYTEQVALLKVANSIFNGNTSRSSGGAIFVESGGRVEVTESTFTANEATNGDGGAIDIESNVSSVTILGTYFSTNNAGDDGGAIWNDTALSITDSSFTGNFVFGSGDPVGGALWTRGNTDIDNAYFGSNEAEQGGAVYALANIEIGNSTFDFNEALADGGAIKSDTLATVIHSTFRDNRAGSGADGGALRAENLELTSSYFASNYANNHGGGVFIAGYATILTSAFYRNNAAGSGGGVYIDGDSAAVSRIESSSFIQNGDDTAAGLGGGLYHWDNGSLEVLNSTFVGNRASEGAGIYFHSDSAYDDTIAYTTIVGNRLSGVGTIGAGIYVQSGGSSTLRISNSIIANNDDSAGNTSDVFGESAGNGVLRNSLITSLSSTNVDDSANLRTGDPLLAALANNGGPLIGDDSAYYLPTAIPAWNSPAVGTADPTLTPSITTTQIGTARAGNVAGAMNASAAPPTPPPTYPPSAPLNVTGTGGDASATITWTAPASAGSFPVTDYQAVLSPGGATCLVQAPALSCTITGLTNGTEYTATARALNGAGWGPYSAASEPFTPGDPTPPVTKTIVITGTRAEVRGKPGVIVDGTTTGLVAATVQARVKLAGEIVYRDGTTRIVQPDGSFQWQRRSNKKVYVYFVTDDGEVRSNRVIIAPR